MSEYKVTWIIELEAESAIEAAKLALEIHRDPDSSAIAFDIIDLESGEMEAIDLDDRDRFPDLRSNLRELEAERKRERETEAESRAYLSRMRESDRESGELDLIERVAKQSALHRSILDRESEPSS